MMSARTNAMRMSPGTSPRNPRNPVSGLLLLGSGSSIEERSTVFTGQGYRSAVRHGRSGCGSRFHGRTSVDLDGLERCPHGPSFAKAEPVDGAPRDLGDDRRRAGQPDARAFSFDRDLGDPTVHHVACRPLRLERVQHHVRRAEHAEHIVDGFAAGGRSGHGTTTAPSGGDQAAGPVVERLQPAGEQVHAHQVGDVRRSAARCAAPRACPAA